MLNFCDSNPCINGQCSMLVNDYVCNVSNGCLRFAFLYIFSFINDNLLKQCNSGWANSKACNLDINECDSLKPCLNNASCLNFPGSYKCICPQGFTGQFCQDRIDYCKQNLCIAAQTLTCINNYTADGFDCFCKQGISKTFSVKCQNLLPYFL